MKFNVGDIVLLMSGSEEMTVEKVTVNNDICCVWYDENNNGITRATFPEGALKFSKELKSVE